MFDWHDFFTLAEELATRRDVASLRSAISRDYYSVFNAAFARAESTVGTKPRDISSHQWCWNQYRSTPDITRQCQQLGLNGDRMKRRRVKADYKASDIPRLEEEVQLMLDEVRQFSLSLGTLNHRYPHP